MSTAEPDPPAKSPRVGARRAAANASAGTSSRNELHDRHSIFDRVNYDADSDVLYLHKATALNDADWDETPEDHGMRFNAAGELVGPTIVGPKRRLERYGKLEITRPQPVDLDAGALDDVLAAA